MANLTIAVPEDLKAQMDAQTEVNWSEVCRTAISAYLDNRRNVIPKLNVRIDNLAFVYFPALASPQLRLQLLVKNEMGREVVLDRVLFATTLSIAKTGNQIANLEGAYVNKHILGQDSGVGIYCHYEFGFFMMEKLSRIVKGSVSAQTNFTIFVEGIKQPLTFASSGIIAIDDWNDTREKYQESMSPSK